MNRKRLTFGLICLLVLAILNACSAKENTNQVVGTNSESESGKKPTLKVLGSYAANLDPNKDIMHQEILERTGYDVQYSMLPQDNPEEKLNLEVASGVDYDILMLTPAQFYKLAVQGALMPLDELLEKNGQHIKDAISEKTWELSTYEGKIYGVPQKNERPNIEQALAYREDILEELNLKQPETIEEFYETLKAVKAAKPNMIPLTGYGLGAADVYSAFGLYTDWMEVDGKLLNRYQMPEMKEYLTFMSKLYQEGLIDQDWGINKVATMQEKFTSGKAFAMPITWSESPKVKPALLNNVAGSKLAYMNPLVGTNGQVGIQASLRIERIHAIPKNSKRAEDAIKFIDSKLEPENFTFLTLGEEGVTFKQDGNKYEAIMPIFTEKRGTAYWFLNGIDEKRYPDMWLARLSRDPALLEAFQLFNKDYDKYAKQNPVAFIPPHEAGSKYQQALSKIEEDYVVKVLMGGEKLENYEKFQQNWEQSGGAEIAKAVNDYYQSVK